MRSTTPGVLGPNLGTGIVKLTSNEWPASYEVGVNGVDVVVASGARPVALAFHLFLAPPQKRLIGHRDERSLMSPRFQPLVVAVGNTMEQIGVKGAEARKGYELLGSTDNRDRVELMDAQLVHNPSEVASVYFGRAGPVEALGR